MTYQGRGAWSKVGGTRTLDKASGRTVPGTAYMLVVGEDRRMGSVVAQQIREGTAFDLNEYAVHLGCQGLQVLLNRAKVRGAERLDEDGVIGPATDRVLRAFQGKHGLVVDGQAGPATFTALLLPVIKAEAKTAGIDWTVPAGLIKYESAFDVGAVGYADSNDVGLGQINGPAHPEMSLADRFDVGVVVGYVVGRMDSAINTFGGNERDAVASYNLGIGGARSWIKAGRPEMWQPTGAVRPRSVKRYIDNILGAWDS